MTGTVVQWLMQAGEVITAGVPVLILEAMKMEHEIVAHCDGALAHCFFKPGETVEEGEVLFTWVETASIPKPTAVILSTEPAANETMDIGKPSIERADLSQLRERLAFTLDAKRPAAVQRRRDRAQRTARENLEDLCDPGSLLEYGALAVAAQRSRRSLEDLIVNTPADGMVTGIATINAASFGPDKSSCAVLSYDATVLAGTQGAMNHYKTDRLLGVALQQQLPVVLFAEGGGGRPGDVDQITVAGLNITTFAKFAALSGQVPVLGIVSGRCFAGNAALLGCCDVIIATQDSNIGMGGPAMIEGGGLGKFKPEEIGSSDIQSKNGVIDCLVKDEAQAVQVAKQYLAFTQGVVSEWQAPDQTALRQAVPENRLRSYEVRKVVEGLVDQASSLELRPHFGIGILTYFARIEGRSLGIIANNTFHLGGAIDADAADKAARFMQLCESYGLPILSLIDTPGFMVGPEIEKQALSVSKDLGLDRSLVFPVSAQKGLVAKINDDQALLSKSRIGELEQALSEVLVKRQQVLLAEHVDREFTESYRNIDAMLQSRLRNQVDQLFELNGVEPGHHSEYTYNH